MEKITYLEPTPAPTGGQHGAWWAFPPTEKLVGDPDGFTWVCSLREGRVKLWACELCGASVAEKGDTFHRSAHQNWHYGDGR